MTLAAGAYANASIPVLRGDKPEVRQMHAFFAGMAGPEGLAYDRAGNLYAADENSNAIKMLTPRGEVVSFETGLLRSHAGMAFDSLGNLYTDAEGRLGTKLTPETGAEVGASSFDEDHPLPIEVENGVFQSVSNPLGVLAFGENASEDRYAAAVPVSRPLAEDFSGRIYMPHGGVALAHVGAIGRFTAGALPHPDQYEVDILATLDGWGNTQEELLTRELRRKRSREAGNKSGKQGAASAFGRDLAMITHSQAAPEPTSLALLAFGGLALASRRRRAA
jgi:hypothetical protein